ncbi:MAG: twitch domain-containing radical SAM protein [Pirellulales bacterium]
MPPAPSPTYCPLPWIHLCANPNGRLMLCCEDTLQSESPHPRTFHILEGVAAYWSSPYLAWVREQMRAGEQLQECEVCYRNEAVGLPSKRQHELQQWGVVDRPTEPCYFDLKLGNRCNLGCLMCDPNSSSRLAAEYRALGWDTAPPFETGQMGIPVRQTFHDDYDWPTDARFWQLMHDFLPGIRRLKFTGGEPLLNPHVFTLLAAARQLGRSDLQLQITSNGTILNERLVELLQAFPTDLIISVEGVGRTNEFLRYPSRWEVIQAHLEQLRDAGVPFRINTTVSGLNLLGLPELFEFNHQLHTRRVTLIPIVFPAFLQPGIVPAALAHAARERLADWRRHTTIPEADDYHRWLSGLLDATHPDSRLWSELECYVQRLSAYRGLDWRDYLPELQGFLDVDPG